MTRASYFTSVDMRAGQIRMREENEAKNASQTHQGYYEYEVMTYGLTRVPTTFQGRMKKTGTLGRKAGSRFY
jgi:subtilase family serine protease